MKSILRAKCDDNFTLDAPYITMSDLHDAERAIVKEVQKRYFEREIDMLKAGKPVLKSSSIYRLDPFMQDGLIRVGGACLEIQAP